MLYEICLKSESLTLYAKRGEFVCYLVPGITSCTVVFVVTIDPVVDLVLVDDGLPCRRG
jgi:hypothetical protein